MHILIAVPNQLVRSGVKAIISSDTCINDIAEASTASELKNHVISHQIDMIILHQSMLATSVMPQGHFLVLADKLDEYALNHAYIHGALGYLLESSSISLLQAALHLSQGQFLLDPDLTVHELGEYFRKKQPKVLIESFTQREQEIFELFQQGISNKDIAEHFSISETTVKTHIAHIYGKVGLKGRVARMRIKIGT